MPKKIVYIFLVLCVPALSALSSCIREKAIPDIPGKGETEVAFSLTCPDFAVPATRAYDTDIEELYAIVFAGSDSTAIFAEASSKTGSGSSWTLPLAARSEDCMVLLIANPKGFYDGTTAIPDLEAWLGGKTLQAVCSSLSTSPLGVSPAAPPYGAATLPMSAIVERTSDAGAQGLTVGSTINVQLVRSVSKVTVTHDAIPNFKVLGIERVYNVARQGNYHNSGTTVATSGGTTNYMDGANLIAASVGSVGNTGTTEGTTVYLHETAGASGPFIIIRAEYDGQPGYFKLTFRDNDMVPLDITRNTCYNMHITHADSRGFDRIDDAILSSVSALSYTVTVADINSFDIVYNGYYYLGFSNSRIRLYGPDGAHTLNRAFRIVTNSTAGFTINSITATAGLTVSPVKVLPNTTTLVNVTLAAGFTSGTITIKYGTISHTISVDRTGTPYFPKAGGVIALDGINAAESSYDLADLYFTPDGNPSTSGTRTIQTYSGTVYVHVPLNTSGTSPKYLGFYGSSASFDGRTQYFIYQAYN